MFEQTKYIVLTTILINNEFVIDIKDTMIGFILFFYTDICFEQIQTYPVVPKLVTHNDIIFCP